MELRILTWIKKHKIKTETGQDLDFTDHRYLQAIYDDNSKYLCCTKAGQIGFSTMGIIKTIWLADKKGIDVGYILPTADMVNKFVGSKVNRMAQQNPVIAALMADKDSITQKQIGEHYIHYLGAMTERSAIMLSLDMLVADEYNKAPQEILETYNSRLQHSKFGYKWVFSNPTIPDFGVDRFWNISDQKKWHVKHSCGKAYPMDESCIDYERQMFACPFCHGEITDEERKWGFWKATATGEWSGYWIPLWINPRVNAKTICDYKKNSTKEYFYNFVAGLSYISVANQLSQQALEKCLTSTVNDQTQRVVIGLDTGHNLHYTLMNKQGLFYHGYCESVAENAGRTPNYDPYDEIDKLLGQTFKNSILVADQGGDLIGIRRLQAKYPGRVFLCWFTKETKNQRLTSWGVDKEYGKVLADRNRVMQLAVDQINDATVTINGTKEDWQPFFNHCLNIYRAKEISGVDENDPQYGWRWVWKRKGADHFFLAFCYGLIGLDKFGEELATFIKREDSMKFPVAGTTANGIIPARRYGIRADFNQ